MRFRPLFACRVILSACVLALALAASARADDRTSSPDSTASIRGTEAPLSNNASPLRYALRGVLFVPYAAVEVVAWPAEQVVRLNEQYRIFGRLTHIPLLKGESGSVRLFFGYESGLQMSIAGIVAESWDVFATGDNLALEGGYLTPKKNVAAFAYVTPRRRFQISLIGLYDNKTNRAFYGLGPHSPDERVQYDRRRALGEIGVRFYPWTPFFVEVTGYTRDQHVTDPEYGATDLSDAFERANGDRYAGLEGSLVLDKRDDAGFASQGMYVRVYGGANKSGHSDDADYRHYGGEVQAFINLYRHTRVLALRAYAEGVDADDPGAIPFEELPRFGGKVGQRGYHRYRFADRNALLLVTEYRYRVTQHVFGELFVDFGSVAREWEYLRLADVDPSYGFGLSFGMHGHRLSAHIARSVEGNEFFVGTERVFQPKSRRLR